MKKDDDFLNSSVCECACFNDSNRTALEIIADLKEGGSCTPFMVMALASALQMAGLMAAYERGVMDEKKDGKKKDKDHYEKYKNDMIKTALRLSREAIGQDSVAITDRVREFYEKPRTIDGATIH